MHGFADSFTIDALRAGAYEMNSEIISSPLQGLGGVDAYMR